MKKKGILKNSAKILVMLTVMTGCLSIYGISSAASNADKSGTYGVTSSGRWYYYNGSGARTYVSSWNAARYGAQHSGGNTGLGQQTTQTPSNVRGTNGGSTTAQTPQYIGGNQYISNGNIISSILANRILANQIVTSPSSTTAQREQAVQQTFGANYTGNIGGYQFENGKLYTGNIGGYQYKNGKLYTGNIGNAMYINGKRVTKKEDILSAAEDAIKNRYNEEETIRNIMDYIARNEDISERDKRELLNKATFARARVTGDKNFTYSMTDNKGTEYKTTVNKDVKTGEYYISKIYTKKPNEANNITSTEILTEYDNNKKRTAYSIKNNYTDGSRQISRKSFKSDGSENYTITQRYNRNGKLERQTNSKGGKGTKEYIYSPQEDGTTIVKVYSFDEKGNKKTEPDNILTYDEKGNLIKSDKDDDKAPEGVDSGNGSNGSGNASLWESAMSGINSGRTETASAGTTSSSTETFTGWKDDVYYVKDQKKYKRDSKGIVTTIDGKTKVTAWLGDERYADGKLIIKKNDKDKKYYEVELNDKGRFKSYKGAITRWVGNQYFKDGKLYAELYNKTTGKVAGDGLAYKTGYKDKDGKIDESKLVKNELLGSKFFNEKGEMVFATSNGKAYKTEKGKITKNLYSGIAGVNAYNNGVLVAKLKDKKLYVPEKDDKGKEKLEKLYSGFVGTYGYQNGVLVARLHSDKTYHKVKSDGSGYMTGEKYTGYIGSTYFKDGKKSQAPTTNTPTNSNTNANSGGSSTASGGNSATAGGSSSTSGNKKFTGWKNGHYYENDVMIKNTTKKIDGKEYTFDQNGNLLEGWKGNQFFKKGILYAELYNKTTGKVVSDGLAYKVGYKDKNGKIDESKLVKNELLGTKFFNSKGEMVFATSNGKVYKTEKGKITSDLYSGIAGVNAYNNGVLVAKLKNNKLYVPEKDSKGNEKLEKLYSGFVGTYGYQNGVLVARLHSDKTYHKVKSDGSGYMTSAKYTGYIGSTYFKDGKKSQAPTTTTTNNNPSKPAASSTNNNTTNSALNAPSNVTKASWVGNKNYGTVNGKLQLRYIKQNGKVYHVNSKGQADTSKPVTAWILNEYYEKGVLKVVIYDKDKKTLTSKGIAYNVDSNGKINLKSIVKNKTVGSKSFDKNGKLKSN